MTKEEAYILLSFHSCKNNDIENEKWENGFLGSLRPFQGKLYECNFIEIMECLKVLADDFMKPTINQTLLRMLSPLCIRDAAIIGSAAFLDPCIKISPLREALPVTWISSNLLLPKSLLLYSLWLFLLYVTSF